MSTTGTTDHYAAANKAHFNTIAHEYDEIPHAAEGARRSAEAMRKAYVFTQEATTVMDYACGTGLVSRELVPYCKRIVGVDISQGMVDQFNNRVYNQGIPPEEMQAVCAELKGIPGELGDEKFDVVLCSAAYHHFTSIDEVTLMLAYFLKPGGVLLVVDISKREDAHGHVQHVIPHHAHHVPHKGGLSESDMHKAFENAGLQSFEFDSDAIRAIHNGHNVRLFIAKGLKPL